MQTAQHSALDRILNYKFYSVSTIELYTFKIMQKISTAYLELHTHTIL
jgi:hypothetical protein